MQLSAWTSGLTNVDTDCLTIFIDHDGNLISHYSDELKPLLSFEKARKLLDSSSNSSLLVPLDENAAISSILLWRLPKTDATSQQWRDFSGKLATRILGLNTESVTVDLSGLHDITAGLDMAEELTIALEQSQYRYEEFKSKKKPARKVQKILFATTADKDASDAIKRGESIGQGINLCRDLGNKPGNACTPTYLAERAMQMQELGINTSILDEEQMRELGMGSLLSVSAGSVEPAKLIVMEYRGAGENAKPYALVGKGITFDTGGISLKPGAAMDEMKFDMCGAASVFGAVHAVAKMKLPINLVAIVAAAENMPSGNATKPGDVVTSMSGQTIEILNTDAEGRLVLCDALSYVARFEPETTIDIATLTGACVIALGSHASGLYANDEQLATDLLTSGEKTGDRAWRMPLWPEYDKQLESNFADMANIGGREAGSVTAACFLARFTKGQKWAHLDIAGTAWKSGKAKGATGRPVRLLTDYLLSRV
jgi:leucyl aminopeptidase